jgi:transcriptional regulator with XRE-family HTH domain
LSFIGDEIKRTRKAHGMTSRDVATQVTLTPQYVRLIECGGATPAMDTALRICNLFPDADSARWAWLVIRDQYGDGVFHLLWDSAVKGERRRRPAQAGGEMGGEAG